MTPQLYRPRLVVVVAVAAFAASLVAKPAIGQADSRPLSPFGLRLGSTVVWDTNVFRTPDSAPDPQAARGIAGRSDRITTTTIGVLFDKFYSQQHFVANVEQRTTRYDKFSFLDNEGLNYRALWLWQLTPRISGTLSADRAVSILPFDVTQVAARNVSITRNRIFNVDGWLFGGWHLLGGFTETERTNSLAFSGQPSISQTSTEFGLRYVALSQSSITLSRRESRGTNTGQSVDFVNFLDSGFRTSETDLRAIWIVSGRSTLNGRLLWTERKSDNLSQRNFSALGRELVYSWIPAGRLTMIVSALRVISPFALDTSSTYLVADTLSFAPTWRVSEKINLTMIAAHQVNNFLGPVVPVAGPSRRDTYRRLSLGAGWTVHPKVTLGATLQREERSSNAVGIDFRDTTLGATATLSY